MLKGRDVKSTWKTIAQGGESYHFQLGDQEESQIKCGLCEEYLMLAIYMCYVQGSSLCGCPKDCLQLIPWIRLSKNIIDIWGISQIRLFQTWLAKKNANSTGKKKTFQTGLSHHSITRKAVQI